MTDIQKKVSGATTGAEVFKLLQEADAELLVLSFTAGSIDGDLWFDKNRKLFFAKSDGDGGSGLMAIMTLLAAKTTTFKLDLMQPASRRPNIDIDITLADLVDNQSGVVQKIKDILWPVQEVEADVQTDETTEALSAEFYNDVVNASLNEPEAPKEEAPKAEAKVEEPKAGAPSEDVPMLISMDELESFSLLGEESLLVSASEPVALDTTESISFAPEPGPVSEPVSEDENKAPISFDDLPEPPIMAELVINEIPVEEPHVEPVADGLALSEPDQPAPQLEISTAELDSIPTPEPQAPPPEPPLKPEPPAVPEFQTAEQQSERIYAQVLKATSGSPQASLIADLAEAAANNAPQAPPTTPRELAQSGRFQNTEPPPVKPVRKRLPIGAITTGAAAIAVVCAVGFSLFNGITSGAQASKADADATYQFVDDTIRDKSATLPKH